MPQPDQGRIGSASTTRQEDPSPAAVTEMSRLTAEKGLRLTLVDSPSSPHRRCRFYCLSLHPTLWGEVSVVREWGRHGTRPHHPRRLVTHHPDLENAAASLPDLLVHRLRRGYR